MKIFSRSRDTKEIFLSGHTKDDRFSQKMKMKVVFSIFLWVEEKEKIYVSFGMRSFLVIFMSLVTLFTISFNSIFCG